MFREIYNDNFKIVLILFLIVIFEFFLESYIAKRYYNKQNLIYKIFKKHHFSFLRYLACFGIPFITVMAVILKFYPSMILVFLSFAILGTFCEWLVGFAYYNIVGKRLWTYDKFNIQGHTSWLAMPLWGIVGSVFWFLTQGL